MTRHGKALLTYAINLLILTTLFFCLRSRAYAGDDWQPIAQEELKMTSEPKAPGVPALFLYRQVDRDDADRRETIYQRIKILTEEGRKYADVEIPFLKGRDNIKGIKARTIQPDGSVTNLEGNVYEKIIVKAKGVKFLAKTFTMPDVRVGSIIEYRYVDDINPDYIYDSYWTLSSDLFTKLAKFSLRKYPHLLLVWSWPNGLPEGTQPPKENHGTVYLEAQNIPAFQTEDYMPPERELKYRVDFVYQALNTEKDQAKFWDDYAKLRFINNEQFLDRRKQMEAALATIVQPADDAQTKLQKIYARVQQLRNFSFEREKTAQEVGRDQRRDIRQVDDIWKQEGGNRNAINFLFVGLVRAAGMEASFVLVSTRDSYFFKPELVNSRQLNHDVVLVRLDGKDLYFDPGTAHMPFGLLPWYETAVKGLLPNKNGGTWIQTPAIGSDVSKIERKAALRLTDDGTLEGKLTVTYSGLEAAEIRRDGDDQDDAARKKLLDNAAREILPVDAEVTLTKEPDWTGSSFTFAAEYSIKVQGWTSNAGRRQIMPAGLFSGGEKHVFEHANRTHPVYFHHAFAKIDDVTVTLPQGWKIGSLPSPANQDQKVVAFNMKVEEDHGALHISRVLRIDVLAVNASHYSALRQFFQFVRSGDELQIVLQPAS
jgi:hypothetical protein